MERSEELRRFLCEQGREWALLGENVRKARGAQVRELEIGGRKWEVQLNEARAVSTGADVSAEAVRKRKCFLCGQNRPKEQRSITSWLPGYEFLANPYPIVEDHVVIAATEHTPQDLTAEKGRDMYRIAEMLRGFAVIFNGAKCGASAPDHFHFQAVPASSLPLTRWVSQDKGFPFRAKVCSLHSPQEAERIVAEHDPWNNLLMWADEKEENESGAIKFVEIPRKAHRPDFYGTGAGEMLVSPGTIDLAGHIVLPRREDFERINTEIILRIIEQTTFPPSEL